MPQVYCSKYKPEEANRTVYIRSQRYADWMITALKSHNPTETPNGIYFSGKSGVGKTHLAAAILNKIITDCPTVPALAMSMQEMIARLKQSYDRGDENEAAEHEIIKTYVEVPLLMIDDLGSEQPTEWAADRIFQIINGRYNNNAPTLVTSNYSLDELANRITPKRREDAGDRTDGIKIADRLAEMCVHFALTGESHRRKPTF